MRKHCKPCEEGAERLSPETVEALSKEVPEWEVREGKTLVRRFPFKDFAKALAFANEVGKLAQEEWHHPELKVAWGSVEVVWYTHSLGGLSENDFVMAKKLDEHLALGAGQAGVV